MVGTWKKIILLIPSFWIKLQQHFWCLPGKWKWAFDKLTISITNYIAISITIKQYYTFANLLSSLTISIALLKAFYKYSTDIPIFHFFTCHKVFPNQTDKKYKLDFEWDGHFSGCCHSYSKSCCVYGLVSCSFIYPFKTNPIIKKIYITLLRGKSW